VTSGDAARQFVPSARRVHADRLHDLERALAGVIGSAAPSISQPERVIVMARALSAVVLDSDRWCAACQADPEKLCKDHHAAAELVMAFQRLALRHLPGEPEGGTDL
jgi:hypothetical protein